MNSALKWTAADDSEWITCDESEGYLVVTVAENSALTERSGKITVTNGIETAEMIVNQGYYNDAPVLSYPRLSADINNPSQRPIGGISIRFEEDYAPYVEVRISELGLDGAKNVVFDSVLKYDDNYVKILEDDFASALRTNRTYMLELFTRYSEDCAMYERDEDAESDQYYFCMTADGHELLIEGSDYYECTAYNYVSAAIYSTNTWICSSDCDWIDPEMYEITDISGDIEYLDISLAPNYTSQSRTGTITYTAGNKNAVISVTQPSCLPQVLSPSLSETQSSPTTLNGGGVVMSVYCDTLTYSKYYRGSWGEEKVYFKVASLVETEHSIVIESGDFDANATYRFTLTKGDYTKQYYVKFNSTTKNYVALYNDGLNLVTSLAWDISSGASSRIIEAYANKAFTVSSTQSWLTVSPAKGYADEDNEFTVTAAKNTTSNERTAKLQFKIGTTVSAELTVTQAASDSLAVFVERDDAYTKYNTGDVIKTVFGSGDDFEVAVMASDLWNAKSNCDWITFDDETSVEGIDPYESVYMTVDANTTGRTRTGTVTISCGNKTVTLTVEQAPKMDSITVLSPDFSTNYKTPTVRIYDDIVVKWNAVDNAVIYLVRIFPEDTSLKLDEFASFRKEITADGSAAYSVVIPKDVLSLNGSEGDRISVGAYDMYGDSVGKSMYFINTQAEAVRLDNSMTPVWDNAEDIAVSRTFAVSSTGNWTASSGSSWIAIDKTSGVTGDTLTVSLQTNTGAARSGYVTVKTGSTSIVLTVNQCAVLEKYPQITSPVYSSDSGAPTMIQTDTSSLTVNWNAAPQAEFYEIEILTYKANAVMETVCSSPRLRKGENTYTFGNLELEPGRLYVLSIMQSSRLGAGCDYTYFMPEDPNAWVLAGNKEKIEYSLDCGEDYGRAVITSSGMWTASADVDWILLDDSHITSADLAEDGYTAADFSSYRGYSGDKLYMSALKNPDSKMRTGTVTVRCGSDEAIITVSQKPDYKVAEIYSPVLGKSDDESVSLPMGNVVLHWTACAGGKGTYQVVLEELEDGYYYDIHEVTGITSTQYSIPSNLLREGGYYRVGLYSDIEGIDTDRSPGKRYYFHVRYTNELAVSADVSFSGDTLLITSSASGGAGDYSFGYELIQDGSSKIKTDLSNGTNYSFTVSESSVYQVVVYCRDAEGNTAKFVSANIDPAANADDSIELSRNSWMPASGGDSVSLSVTSGGAWNIEFYPDWISCSASKGSDGDKITLIAERNGEETRSGTVVITSGTASAKLEVVQNGMDLHAEITVPKTGTVVSAGSVCVEWTEPDGAEGFVFSLTDMTSDLLIINQMPVDDCEYIIHADALLRGHSYKVEIGTVCNGQKYWSTAEFSVEPSQAGNNPNPIPGQHVHTYQRNVSTITTENETTEVHKVTTKYYEVCSECGDKTEYKTDTVLVSHVYSSSKKYEAEHPHKVFVKCACGAAKYLEDEYKTSNGVVQEPESICCICHGDVFDYDNPRPLNGNWVVFCENCDITKQIDAPASEEDAVHVHFPAVYYDSELNPHEYCSICEPRTLEQFEEDSLNLQRKMEEIQANADAVAREHAVNNIVSKSDSVSNLLSHFKERNRTAWVQIGRMKYRQATLQWGDVIRSIIPGSEVVNDIRKEAVQYALASVLGYTDKQLETFKSWIEEFIPENSEILEGISEIYGGTGEAIEDISKNGSWNRNVVVGNTLDIDMGIESSDVIELIVNIGLDVSEYEKWSQKQKLIFYDKLILDAQSLEFLTELKTVYQKDKIIVEYCKDMIEQIKMFN